MHYFDMCNNFEEKSQNIPVFFGMALQFCIFFTDENVTGHLTLLQFSWN